jgi:hypothetical protein
MQLRKMTLMLAALGAMGMMLTACGGEERTSLTCSTDADCVSDGNITEICHPDAKVCVQTCATSSDCPSSAKDCSALGGSSSMKDKLICKCSTDQLCQGDTRVSDASTLVCLSGSSVCAPKGTTPACTKDADCAAGQACDLTSGTCKATTVGNSCTGTSQSTCSYGEFCSANKCAAAPVAAATCENFSKSRPQWSVGSTGPVIYDVSFVSYQTAYTYCDQSAGQSDAFIVRVKAYRTDADWPSTRAGLSGFFYVTTGGTNFDIVANSLLVPNTGYNRNTSNLKDAEFNVYLCRPAGSTTIQTGFFFTGGNPVCSQISRP